jgi:putative transposase
VPIAPSTYYDQVNREPSRRQLRDEELNPEITRVHAANYGVYGARKVWLALNREGTAVARCTVERLMAELGLAGATRGKSRRTTIADPAAARPADLVQRQFAPPAPNRLWVADLTYVSTWSGFAYVAFVVDAYARRILGWRVASTMATSMVLDAIEQSIWTRQQEGVLDLKDVVHHTDRGSQYTSIRFSERLAQAGIQPSVGAVGSSYDNALAETINGLYKTELIKPPSRGAPSRTSRWPPPNGFTGSTIAASTSTAATSRPSNWRRPTTLNTGDQPPAESSNREVSGLTGAIHTDDFQRTSSLKRR